MAILEYVWENNKPPLKSKVGIEYRGDGLYITHPVKGNWIQLQLTDHEKRSLLRDLWKEFMQGGTV